MHEKPSKLSEELAKQIDKRILEIESANPEFKPTPQPFFYSKDWFEWINQNTKSYVESREVIAYKERESVRLIRKKIVGSNSH